MLFKVEMVAVHEGMTLSDKARSFVMLGPGQEASIASEVKSCLVQRVFALHIVKGVLL